MLSCLCTIVWFTFSIYYEDQVHGQNREDGANNNYVMNPSLVSLTSKMHNPLPPLQRLVLRTKCWSTQKSVRAEAKNLTSANMQLTYQYFGRL